MSSSTLRWAVSRLSINKCEVSLVQRKMEEVEELKYLVTATPKYRSMEGEVREKAVRGKQVTGSIKNHERYKV